MRKGRMVLGSMLVVATGWMLAACGGGGTTTGSSGSVATIQGQVSGTVVVAVDNDTNLETGRVSATGVPKTFSLTLPTGRTYKFYLLENEGSGGQARVYPIDAGTGNVFELTRDADGRTIDLGMITPDLATGDALPANDPGGFPGVIGMGEDRRVPPSLSGSMFVTGDLQGSWDFHSIVTSGAIGWMTGAMTMDNTGMGSMWSQVRNGMSWPSLDDIPFARSPSGMVGMTNDNTFHGVLTQDRNMMVATWTDNTGGDTLMIARKRGGTFGPGDLSGSWQFHRLTAGTDNATSGWAYGEITMGAGSATILAIQTSDNNMIDLGRTFLVSMDDDGIMTVPDDNTFRGIMSRDKTMIVATATNGQGNFDFWILMKTIVGVVYSMDDLAGAWTLHGATSGDPNDGHWNFGRTVMNSEGRTMFNHVIGGMTVFSRQRDFTVNYNTGGINLIHLMGTGMSEGMMDTVEQTFHGMMNSAKNMAVMTFSDGNGGYQLIVNVK